jgi:hypothetical protein
VNRQLCRRAGPALLAEPGVAPIVAQLLISWSHPGRVRDEAAFASRVAASHGPVQGTPGMDDPSTIPGISPPQRRAFPLIQGDTQQQCRTAAETWPAGQFGPAGRALGPG